jgi:hypothetical protein
MVEQLTFQLENAGSNPSAPLHYIIEPIRHDAAKDFVERWHYSHLMPTGKNICYGLKRKGSIYAVIVYGIGVNPYQAQFLGVDSCIEIKRMCRREPKEDYFLSRFINLTTKIIKRSKDFDAVVAFADPEHGHQGTVYKAAGYEYSGLTNPEWHLEDEFGNRFHRRIAYRMARRNKIEIGEARNELNLHRIKTEPKHRWVRFFKIKTDRRGSSGCGTSQNAL